MVVDLVSYQREYGFEVPNFFAVRKVGHEALDEKRNCASGARAHRAEKLESHIACRTVEAGDVGRDSRECAHADSVQLVVDCIPGAVGKSYGVKTVEKPCEGA